LRWFVREAPKDALDDALLLEGVYRRLHGPAFLAQLLFVRGEVEKSCWLSYSRTRTVVCSMLSTSYPPYRNRPDRVCSGTRGSICRDGTHMTGRRAVVMKFRHPLRIGHGKAAALLRGRWCGPREMRELHDNAVLTW
jgi:hypothetical protein